MSLICACPEPEALADIPIIKCTPRIGQIQKVIFQRIFSAPGTKNAITIATANPNLLATWTALLAASDSTKVTPSPYIQAPVIEPGAVKEFGSGNEVLDGIPIPIGREPSTFTAALYKADPATVRALKSYQCEEIGVFIVNENGLIFGLADATPAVKFMPVPIRSLFVGDTNPGGLDGMDQNAISWRFLPNWSDNLHAVTPADFNPLTDLVTPPPAPPAGT